MSGAYNLVFGSNCVNISFKIIFTWHFDFWHRYLIYRLWQPVRKLWFIHVLKYFQIIHLSATKSNNSIKSSWGSKHLRTNYSLSNYLVPNLQKLRNIDSPVLGMAEVFQHMFCITDIAVYMYPEMTVLDFLIIRDKRNSLVDKRRFCIRFRLFPPLWAFTCLMWLTYQYSQNLY